MIQKVINVFAVASFAVSSAIAASIIDGIKSQVMGGIGGAALGGGALTGDVGLPIGTQPEPPAPAPQSAPSEFANF